jgi:hypothetical protein
MMELQKGPVHEFYLKNYRQFSKTELSEKILLECGLNIRSENDISELTNGPESFSSATRIVAKRLNRLLQSLKPKRQAFSPDDPRYHDVFFDLRDFPDLIAEEESQNLSQASTSSRVSNLSDLEVEVPSQRKPKRLFPFDELGPKSKKMRTRALLDQLLETSEKESISPEKLIAYLGYKVSYQKNKRTAQIFKDIYDGKDFSSVQEVDTSTALYLREHCQIGRNIYTDLRIALKEKVLLPPHNLLSKQENKILPELIEFEQGWKVNLTEAISKTLEGALKTVTTNQESLTGEGLFCKFVGGCDGSGGHSVYNSASSLASGKNVKIAYQICCSI